MGERSHQDDAAGDGSDVEEQGSIVRASPKSGLGETGCHKSRLTLELPSAVDPDKTRAAFDRGARFRCPKDGWKRTCRKNSLFSLRLLQRLKNEVHWPSL